MSTFVGNDTLAAMGERWNAQIRAFAESVEGPEARMLAERLGAGLSGEVEDRLFAAVLAGVVADLRERLEALEAPGE